MAPLKILTLIGARPQFVKAAAVSEAIRQHNNQSNPTVMEEILVHSGQHYDYEMSEIFFEELPLNEPDYYLEVGSETHAVQTSRVLTRLENVIDDADPDVVLVYGDTNTTLGGAVCASKLNIPIAHVEAGLRSFNDEMPEEINRKVTDHVSDWLFVPSDDAVDNLEAEGIEEGVFQVGDVMQDVLKNNLKTIQTVPEDFSDLCSSDELVLATVHRAKNTDNEEKLTSIMESFKSLQGNGREVLLLAHPRTQEALDEYEIEPGAVQVTEPVSYLTMLQLIHQSSVIATDSGGVQKEAYWLETPCVTLRSETEWTETVRAGWNQVVGSEKDDIINAIENSSPPPEHPPLYGEGNAAKKIVDRILNNKISK